MFADTVEKFADTCPAGRKTQNEPLVKVDMGGRFVTMSLSSYARQYDQLRGKRKILLFT